MNNSQARHAAIMREAEELFAMKNASYQDSWRKQGWRGNVSRILEKAQRLRSLLWRPSVLLNGSKEHPRETLLDIINTATFAIINMDDGVEWGEGVDDKPLVPPHDVELDMFQQSYGRPDITREQMEAMQHQGSARNDEGWPDGYGSPFERVHRNMVSLNNPVPPPGATEETRSDLPVVPDVPTPGEDKKPVGEGSGPRNRPSPTRRKVKDAPQA